jgi:5-methylcytosine-specific restriction endonuclease McrA
MISAKSIGIVIAIAISGLAMATDRLPQWGHVRSHHLSIEPACAWCRTTNRLEVHHILPVNRAPELELVETNLITLCETTNRCHFTRGHLGNWNNFNPSIRKQCTRHAAKLKRRQIRW